MIWCEKKLKIFSITQINYVLVVILGLIVGFLIGNRDIDIGSDTYVYHMLFNQIINKEIISDFFMRLEPAFLVVIKLLSLYFFSAQSILIILSIFTFIFISLGFRNKSNLFQYPLWVSLFLLSYPFFYSMSTNVVRQGMAFAFVLLALDRKISKRTLESILFIIIATLFHYGSIIYFIAAIICEVIPVIWIFLIWLSLSFLSYVCNSDYIIQFFLNLLDFFNFFPSYINYLSSSDSFEYPRGIKLPWVLFSSLPAIFIFIQHQRGYLLSAEGSYTFRIYSAILLLHVFTLGIPYNDRIILSAWMLWPFIFNPTAFLKKEKITHLSSIFMAICYTILICLAPLLLCYELKLF